MSDDDNLDYRFQNLHEFVKVARQNLEPQQLGLSDRRLGERDDAGAQPAGARFDRLPAARAARRVERRLQPRDVRPEIAHPGAVRAGRLAWRISSRAAAARSPRRPRKFGNGMILSSVSHPGLEKTAEAAGDGFHVFQLYVRGDEAWVDDHVRRAMDNGYNAFCLTVDTDSYSRRERDIAKRHERRRVRVGDARIYQARFNWRDIERIKPAVENPAHHQGHRHRRGRQDRGRSRGRCRLCVEPWRTAARPGRRLDRRSLPEVVEAVGGRGKVWVDGSITPRHRCRQGDHPRRRCVVGRPALCLRPRRRRRAGGRAAVRDPRRRDPHLPVAARRQRLRRARQILYPRRRRRSCRPHVHSPFPHLDLPIETY